VWQLLGDPSHYIEPFIGGGSVLLARPSSPKDETIGDANGLVANFWRAVRIAPDSVAHYAWHPPVEADLRARLATLGRARRPLADAIQHNPHFCDARFAGWWAWCQIVAINGGGPRAGSISLHQDKKRLPDEKVVEAQVQALHTRLARVRVTCGDFERALSHSALTSYPSVGVFLDPPYAAELRRPCLYFEETDPEMPGRVRKAAVRCFESGARVVLAGLEGEYDLPGWTEIPWKAVGLSRTRLNGPKERLWASPNCQPATMFDVLR
jgi:DNA adenine methylase